jgi:glycosyltransferase involved in cell wall biosynthesis
MYGRFIKELVEDLVGDNFRISVVTPRLFRQSESREIRKREMVYRFWFWSGNRLLVTYRRVPVFRILTYLISGMMRAMRVIQKDSCQLVHAHWAFPAGVMAVTVGRLLRKPVILTIHGSDARWAFEKKGLFRILFAWVAKRADQVTVVSQHIAEHTKALGIKEEKIHVFPMGVSERFFSSRGTRTSRPEYEGKTVIVSNRHLLPSYNVDCLIRAVPRVVSRCDHVMFVIAGDGERRAVLESKVRQNDLLPWVHFLGAIPHDRMSDLLKSCHIFVSTSLSDGTSVSMLEAMACGLFPVVTDIPTNREWIKNGKNGFLTPTNNEVALADRLIMAIEHAELREKAKPINTQIVRERASWEKVTHTLVEIYGGLIGL